MIKHLKQDSVVARSFPLAESAILARERSPHLTKGSVRDQLAADPYDHRISAVCSLTTFPVC